MLENILEDDLTLVSEKEKVKVSKLKKYIESGRVVILGKDRAKKVGLGYNLSTKINLNLGTSSVQGLIDNELQGFSFWWGNCSSQDLQ